MSNIVSFPMNNEAAMQSCIEIAGNIGRALAKRIIANVSAFELEPHEIDDRINALTKEMRQMFLDDGVSKEDAEAMVQLIYKALVTEGAQITTLMHWQGGNA